MYIICPECDHDFWGEEWQDEACPKCGLEYEWDETFYEDQGTQYETVVNFKKKGENK